jgi:hypothetical protein
VTKLAVAPDTVLTNCFSRQEGVGIDYARPNSNLRLFSCMHVTSYRGLAEIVSFQRGECGLVEFELAHVVDILGEPSQPTSSLRMASKALLDGVMDNETNINAKGYTPNNGDRHYVEIFIHAACRNYYGVPLATFCAVPTNLATKESFGNAAGLLVYTSNGTDLDDSHESFVCVAAAKRGSLVFSSSVPTFVASFLDTLSDTRDC